MRTKAKLLHFVIVVLAFLVVPLTVQAAEQPILIGCPLATAFLYGWDAERAIKLAVDEINAAGGVKVGDKKRPFAVDVIDTRDLEAAVPVSEALLAVEKLILEKKVSFLVGGPVRSEAALAVMPLLVKHKMISILTTGALTPKYNEIIAQDPEKFKYCFRISGEAKWMVMGELVPCLVEIGKNFNLDRLMIGPRCRARTGRR